VIHVSVYFGETLVDYFLMSQVVGIPQGYLEGWLLIPALGLFRTFTRRNHGLAVEKQFRPLGPMLSRHFRIRFGLQGHGRAFISWAKTEQTLFRWVLFSGISF